MDTSRNKQAVLGVDFRVDHSTPILRPRRRGLDVQHIVCPESFVDVEVDGVVEARHDLHPGGDLLALVVSDLVEPEIDAVDGHRAVHDMVVGHVHDGEEMRRAARRRLHGRVDFRNDRRYGGAGILRCRVVERETLKLHKWPAFGAHRLEIVECYLVDALFDLHRRGVLHRPARPLLATHETRRHHHDGLVVLFDRDDPHCESSAVADPLNLVHERLLCLGAQHELRVQRV